MKKGFAIGLLGGSFNPAHGGHRRISMAALHHLQLDEIWWLVSPQNPLKPVEGMAPLNARLRSARLVARHPRIRPTDIETRLGTQRTVETVRALNRRYPQVRFVWLMGSDNLWQFHRWADWRGIAREVPIVVIARPGYAGKCQFAPAMGWLRRWRHTNPAGWRNWILPAIGFAYYGFDQRSATVVRRTMPDWARNLSKEDMQI